MNRYYKRLTVKSFSLPAYLLTIDNVYELVDYPFDIMDYKEIPEKDITFSNIQEAQMFYAYYAENNLSDEDLDELTRWYPHLEPNDNY